MSKIITSYDHPPIPVRSFDWSACYEGFEEDGPCGHGATEAEAIADLTENYDPPCPMCGDDITNEYGYCRPCGEFVL